MKAFVKLGPFRGAHPDPVIDWVQRKVPDPYRIRDLRDDVHGYYMIAMRMPQAKEVLPPAELVEMFNYAAWLAGGCGGARLTAKKRDRR